MPSTPPYPEEFRREAVALVRSSEKSIPQLAAELGVSPQSLRNWTKQVQLDAGERRDGLSSDERDELRRLRRENRRLEQERDILKKPRPSSPRRARGGDRVSLHRRGEGQPSRLVAVRGAGRLALGLSAWQNRPPSSRASADAGLLELIELIHEESRRTYGSARVHSELRLEHDVRVGRKRVARLIETPCPPNRGSSMAPWEPELLNDAGAAEHSKTLARRSRRVAFPTSADAAASEIARSLRRVRASDAPPPRRGLPACHGEWARRRDRRIGRPVDGRRTASGRRSDRQHAGTNRCRVSRIATARSPESLITACRARH
jgi:transposase